MKAENTDLAELVAAPGMTMGEAHAASTAGFRLPRDTESPCLAQPRGLHRFVLRDAERGVLLPPGRFSVLEASRGVIFRLRTTPQVGYLDLASVVELAAVVVETFEKAGWLARSRAPETQLLKHLSETGGDRVGSWLADEWMAELSIRRAVERESGVARLLRLEQDGYLATCVIWDIRRTAAAGD